MNISATNNRAIPSPALARWVRKASSQNFGRHSLHSLVFGEGTFAYFLYRTRLQMMNLLVRLVLHMAEYFLIFHAMPTILFAAIAIRVASTAIESGWWGFLEGMRARIRKLNEKNDISSITIEIEDWLAVATRLGMVVILASIMMVIWFGHSPSHDALILAMGAQLASRLVLRTLYSGAYAIRRVYIQFQWIIAIELLVFALAWLAYPYIGSWALPICLVISMVLSVALSYHFIHRTLSFMRIAPTQFFKPLALVRIGKWHKGSALLLSAGSMISIKIHDIVILIALAIAAEGKSLLFAAYLIMPIIRTAMGWSQIMYFDFFKQQLYVFKGFREYFERRGIIYSLFYATLLSGLCWLVLWSISAEMWAITLTLYIICAALLGYIQTALFARQHHRAIIVLALMQYSLLGFLVAMKTPFEYAASISLLVPFFWGWKLLTEMDTSKAEGEQEFLPWVRYVSEQQGAVHGAALILKDPTLQGFKMQISNAINLHFGTSIRFCHNKKRFYLIGVDGGIIDREKLDAVLAMAAGYIDRAEKFQASNGAELLAQLKGTTLQQENILPTLMEEFKAIFPEGFIQLPQKKNKQLSAALNVDDKRLIISSAIANAEGRKFGVSSDWFITTAQSGGYIEAIFLAKKNASMKENSFKWRNILSQYN